MRRAKRVSFSKVVKKYKRRYKSQRATAWKSWKPEPGINVRERRLRGNIDLVKLYSTRTAFRVIGLEKTLKGMKLKKRSAKELIIKGRAYDHNGRLMKDKTFTLSAVTVRRGSGYLVQRLAHLINTQEKAYGWVVYEKFRRRRAVKGERIRSLKVDIFLRETTKHYGRTTRKTKGIRGRHGR